MNFQDFLKHPFISTLVKNEQWTISTTKKMPIDMNILRNKGKIKGAKFDNGNKPLVTLLDVINIYPKAFNATYLLNQAIDNFVVLDIEPKCPEDLKENLLRLPYIYGEVSMSGKGFHLVFRKPKTIYEDILLTKPAIQEEYGYYEILQNHYVTFTGNMIYHSKSCNIRKYEDFLEIYDKLASTKKIAMTREIDTSYIPEINKIPFAKEILSILKQIPFNKKLEDYGNPSVYEFGLIGFYRKNLELICKTTRYEKHKYSDIEKISILYEITKEKLPHREKHNELRKGMPMLLYDCIRAIGRETIVDHEKV